MKKIIAFSAVLLLCACNMQTTQPMIVSWTTEVTAEEEFGMPVSTITLIGAGETDVLFQTECDGSASTENAEVEGAIASIQCWWAGGGDHYAVFQEGDSLNIMHRTVDEEAGFGEWEEVAEVQ